MADKLYTQRRLAAESAPREAISPEFWAALRAYIERQESKEGLFVRDFSDKCGGGNNAAYDSYRFRYGITEAGVLTEYPLPHSKPQRG